MKKIGKSVIFYYQEKDAFLVDDICQYLDEKTPEIYDFFGIEKENHKAVIHIIETKKELDDIHREFHPEEVGSELPKWLIGFCAFNQEIYYLSLNDYKSTSHAFSESDYDRQLIYYQKTLVHEYVHYVHRLFCQKYNCPSSYQFLSEGIAAYLSGQKENQKLEFHYSLDDLLNSGNCYDGWYLVTSYILKNYSREFFLELLKDKDKAIEFLKNYYDIIKKYFS